jgi:hypothetical protein
MKPDVGFFDLLWPTHEALPAWVVSISADVAADITLSRVITWVTVYINLESHLRSRCAVTNLHRALMC